MRLIDADAIPWTDLNDNPNSKIRVLITFADKVNRMPTIEERKKGKWELQTDHHEKHYGWYICSECGAWIGTPANFCSECGADMRGTP